MREGYTYDDETPSSRGSFVNRNKRRLNMKFSGKKMGHIEIDPKTKEMRIVRDENESEQTESQD